MKTIPQVRVRAFVLVRRGTEVLLVDQFDSIDGAVWGVPGGGVEFGERAEDAARRELLEETGIAAGQMTLLSVFENIFLHGEETGHEVCFAFETDATGTEAADVESIAGQESDGSPMLLRWVPAAQVAAGRRVTWPGALPKLVAGWTTGTPPPPLSAP